MSSHYIYVRCPIKDCTTTGSIYTGEDIVEGFQRDQWEGETITVRCDEHWDYVEQATEWAVEPTKIILGTPPLVTEDTPLADWEIELMTVGDKEEPPVEPDLTILEHLKPTVMGLSSMLVTADTHGLTSEHYTHDPWMAAGLDLVQKKSMSYSRAASLALEPEEGSQVATDIS